MDPVKKRDINASFDKMTKFFLPRNIVNYV